MTHDILNNLRVHTCFRKPCATRVTTLRDKNWSYTHFGPEVLLWTGNRYIFVEGHQALSVGVLTFWGNLGSHEVQEHKMTAYLSSLRKKVGGAKEIRFEERNRYLN